MLYLYRARNDSPSPQSARRCTTCPQCTRHQAPSTKHQRRAANGVCLPVYGRRPRVLKVRQSAARSAWAIKGRAASGPCGVRAVRHPGGRASAARSVKVIWCSACALCVCAARAAGSLVRESLNTRESLDKERVLPAVNTDQRNPCALSILTSSFAAFGAAQYGFKALASLNHQYRKRRCASRTLRPLRAGPGRPLRAG